MWDIRDFILLLGVYECIRQWSYNLLVDDREPVSVAVYTWLRQTAARQVAWCPARPAGAARVRVRAVINDQRSARRTPATIVRQQIKHRYGGPARME